MARRSRGVIVLKTWTFWIVGGAFVLAGVALLGLVLVWYQIAQESESQTANAANTWNATDLQPSSFFNRDDAPILAEREYNALVVRYGASQNQYVRIGFQDRETLLLNSPSDGNKRCCGSMRPALNDESLLILVAANTSELHPGDIVRFQCSADFLIHRIISVETLNGTTRYVTKGDNNPVDDLVMFGCQPTSEDIAEKVVGVLY